MQAGAIHRKRSPALSRQRRNEVVAEQGYTAEINPKTEVRKSIVWLQVIW